MADDVKSAPTGAKTTAPKLHGIHHSAYRCRDAEETRRFYEDILGLKLRTALIAEEEPGSGRALQFQHLFFEMGDGRYIAFFDEPGGATPKKFNTKNPFDFHIAFEAGSMEELLAFQQHLDANGVTAHGPVDHGFCHSIYFYDPNGLALEITTRDATHESYMRESETHAHADVQTWVEKTRAQKKETGVLSE